MLERIDVMNAGKINEKLLDYFKNSVLYGGSVNEINEDTSLVDEGYIDSTGIIELVAFIESNFDVMVKDSEIIPENFDTLGAISSYLDRKAGGVSKL
jgi:acyl carrier protein